MVRLAARLAARAHARIQADVRNDAVDQLLLYALTGFSASSYFATASGGGEAGAASSVGMISMIRVRGIAPAAHNRFVSRIDGTHGWQQYLLTTGLLIAYFTDGSGAWKQSGGVQLTASDVGRVLVYITWIDAAGVIRGATSRLGQVTTANTVLVGYTPYAGPHSIGSDPGSPSNASNLVDVIAHATFGGAPADAQLQAHFDAARALGDLPATIGGGTMRHRWSLREQLLGVANPAGRKTHGARGFTLANRMQTASPGGFAGVDTGSFWQGFFTIQSLAGGELFNFIVSRMATNAFSGWQLQWRTDTKALGFDVGAGAGFGPVVPKLTLTDGDVGRPILMTLVLDVTASLWRVYFWETQIGTVAFTTYGPAALPMVFGGRAAADYSADKTLIHGFQAGTYAPPLAEIQANAEATRQSGRLTRLPGAVTHRYDFDAAVIANGGTLPASVPNSEAAVDPVTMVGAVVAGVFTETAPPAPAQLNDTVTAAAGDALARVGSPRVVAIDTSIDGRVTKGVLGFGANAYLQTPSPGGVAGVDTGFRIGLWVRFDSLPSINQSIVARTNNSNAGWQAAVISSNRLTFYCVNGAGAFVNAFYQLTAADVGTSWRYVECVHTGAVLRILIDGVQVSADQAITGFTPFAGPTIVGQLAGAQGASAVSIAAVNGGHGASTLAEVQSAAAATAAQGRLVAIPGKTSWEIQFGQDIAANNGLPAQVLDRIGTDHLSRVDIDTPKVGPNGVRGVGPYATSDEWQSAAGGGIVGVNTGFHVVADLYFSKVPTADEFLFSCTNVAGNAGYSLRVTSTGLIRGAIAGVNNSSTYQLTGADLNKRIRIELEKTATVVRLYVNGVQAGADVAAATYGVPASVPMSVGNIRNGGPMLSGWVELVQGGHTNLSAGERTTLNADLTQPAPVIVGKTEKRWRFHDDTAATPTKTPRTSVERVSGASIDVLTRYGAGLQVAQRTERAWSYETVPILYGAQTFSAVNFFETAAGLLGNVSGLWGAVLFIVRSQSVASAGRVLVSRRSTASSGWNASSNTTNATISAVISTTTSTYATPALSIAAGDVGKLLLFGWSMDVPALKFRGYGKRAEIGGGTTIAGTYVPLASGTMQVGRRNGDVVAADAGIEIYGFTCGDGIPTLAEFQSLHDACMAAEDIAAMPGRSSITVSLKRDVLENGGALPALLLNRSGAGDNFARNGAPALASQYARAWGW